jgi:hypothetical protein
LSPAFKSSINHQPPKGILKFIVVFPIAEIRDEMLANLPRRIFPLWVAEYGASPRPNQPKNLCTGGPRYQDYYNQHYFLL